MMETFSLLMAVVLGMPALMALVLTGIQWFEDFRRTRRWRSAAASTTAGAEAETPAHVLLAWCDARQAQARQGTAKPADRTCILRERPRRLSSESFGADASRFAASPEPGGRMPAVLKGGGFASVHLLLNDGAGHYFRVERKLCLN